MTADWQIRLTDDGRHLIYCPECAERECGELAGESS